MGESCDLCRENIRSRMDVWVKLNHGYMEADAWFAGVKMCVMIMNGKEDEEFWIVELIPTGEQIGVLNSDMIDRYISDAYCVPGCFIVDPHVLDWRTIRPYLSAVTNQSCGKEYNWVEYEIRRLLLQSWGAYTKRMV